MSANHHAMPFSRAVTSGRQTVADNCKADSFSFKVLIVGSKYAMYMFFSD